MRAIVRLCAPLTALIFVLSSFFALSAHADDCVDVAKKLAAKRAEYRKLLEEGGYWEATQANGPRSKPVYEVNPEHVAPVRPGKTPLPANAEELYRHAIPDPARDGQIWWARDGQGNYHRFMGTARGPDRQIIVHWNGSTAPSLAREPISLNNVPGYIKKRFELRDEVIKLVKRLKAEGG